MEKSDPTTHGARRGVPWMCRQSIRPEWWHTFPGGPAHFASASEALEGMGIYRRRIALGMRRQKITREEGGRGVGKGGTAFPTARETLVRPRGEPSHLLARCEGGGG